jgi:hypothetical protein
MKAAACQTVPTENYQELVDIAELSLMQITEQCKLMVVLLDSASIQVPQLQEDGVWLTTFRKNADSLFEREKPWIKHDRKNLSTVVKELYLYLNKRSA